MFVRLPLGHLWFDFSHPPAHLSYWKDDGESFLRCWRGNIVWTPNEKLTRLPGSLQATGPGDAGPDDGDVSTRSRDGP